MPGTSRSVQRQGAAAICTTATPLSRHGPIETYPPGNARLDLRSLSVHDGPSWSAIPHLIRLVLLIQSSLALQEVFEFSQIPFFLKFQLLLFPLFPTFLTLFPPKFTLSAPHHDSTPSGVPGSTQPPCPERQNGVDCTELQALDSSS